MFGDKLLMIMPSCVARHMQLTYPGNYSYRNQG